MTRSIASFAVFTAAVAFSLALSPTATEARVFRHVRGDPAGRTLARTPSAAAAPRSLQTNGGYALGRNTPASPAVRTSGDSGKPAWDTVYRTDDGSARNRGAFTSGAPAPHADTTGRRP